MPHGVEICNDSSGPVKSGHKMAKMLLFTVEKSGGVCLVTRAADDFKIPKTAGGHDFLSESGWKDLVSTVK